MSHTKINLLRVPLPTNLCPKTALRSCQSFRLMSSESSQDQIVNRKNKTKRSYYNPEDESSHDDPVQFSKSKAFENPYKKQEDRFHFAKPGSEFTSADFKKKYSTREAKIERLEKIKIKNERNLSFRFSFMASLIYMLMLREENDLDDLIADGMYSDNPELEKSHLEANMRAKENLGKEGDKGYRMMQQRLDLLYARDKATLAQSQND